MATIAGYPAVDWKLATEGGVTMTERPMRHASHAAAGLKVIIEPFIGRLGGQGTIQLPTNDSEEALRELVPDAVPLMTVGKIFDLTPFRNIGLWRAALIEGIG
jgi:hypothetical protein